MNKVYIVVTPAFSASLNKRIKCNPRIEQLVSNSDQLALLMATIHIYVPLVCGIKLFAVETTDGNFRD